MFPYNLGSVIVIATSFFCFMCLPTIDYDESCGKGSTLGICKRLSECPSGLQQVKQERFHNLLRCGFEGREEIVCCPDFKAEPPLNKSTGDIWEVVPTIPRDSSGDRRSVTACKRYIASSKTSIGFYIIEGENASLGEFPHMTQIGYEDQESAGGIYKWECGGSLISSRFVLTAAHCVVKVDGIPPSRVRLGFVDSNFTNNTQAIEREVKNYTVHPDYSRLLKEHDIAVLELDEDVKEDANTYPACLYQINDDPNDLMITGWGNTIAQGAPSRILQKASIEPIQANECSRLFEKRSNIIIRSTHICCLSINSSKDTCQGDSGGPLQKLLLTNSSLYSIVGVTSYGQGCGGVTPGVYTRVSSYLDWIENIVWPINKK